MTTASARTWTLGLQWRTRKWLLLYFSDHTGWPCDVWLILSFGMDHMWGVTTPEGSEKSGTPGWSFHKKHFPMYPKCTDNAHSGRYNEFWGLHVIFSSKITGANISRRSWLVIFAGWIPCDVWRSAKKLDLVTCDIRYGLKSTVVFPWPWLISAFQYAW